MTTRTPLPRKRNLPAAARQEAIDHVLRAGHVYYEEVEAGRLEPTGDENVRLLTDVIEYAAAEQRVDAGAGQFDMNHWASGVVFREEGEVKSPACGTTMCLAGTAAAFTLPADQMIRLNDIFTIEGFEEYVEDGKTVREPITGTWLDDSVAERGADELGLTATQAAALFYLTPHNLGIGDLGDPLPAIRLVASLITGRDFRKVGVK